MLSPVRVYKGEQVPLFTSMTQEISAQCNRTCVFCPNHDFERPDAQMPMALIEKAAEELGTLRYGGRWSPYMYNEPLRDPRLLDILHLIRQQVPRCVININTNADYLDEELLDALVDAGVNQLAINIYSARDGSTNPEKVERGIVLARKRAAVMQRMLDARPHILQTGSLYQHISPKKIVAKVQHKYGVQKDGTNWGGGFKFQNRTGDVEWLADTAKQSYSGMCTRPFRILEMRWTGDVVLCCNDYHGQARFGNLKDHTLVELWNMMSLHHIRAELQDGIRKGLCQHCDYDGGHYQHMIHPVQLQRARS